jgi:hypothetical protein
MLIANSPLAKLALSGTAAAVLLRYRLIGVKPDAAMFIPYLLFQLIVAVDVSLSIVIMP